MTQNATKTSTAKPEFKGAFSSFSTKDLNKTKGFYADTLGLDVKETEEGLELSFDGGQSVFIYPKGDHQPATFTVLNLMVDDIASAVDGLKANGIKFESFGGDIETDENGIMWGKRQGNGPNIAWFKDPAGNFISVVEKA